MGKSCINDISIIESSDGRKFTDDERALAQANGLMVLQGCKREILIGHKKDIYLTELAIETPHQVKRREDAYAHVLRYITGQFSKTRGESQIVSQFKKGWEEFEKTNPDKAAELNYFYESIMADNGLMRQHVTTDLKPAFYETTAHDLSGQKNGETVLIIASSNTKGNGPGEVTMNLVKQLANNRKGRVEKLLVTHPQSTICDAICAQLQRKVGRLATPVRSIPFTEALDINGSLLRTDKVFVTFPAGKCPEIDQMIHKACAELEVFGGQLIHLGGPNKDDRIARGVWAQHQHRDAIMPEAIIETQLASQKRNADIIEGPGKIAALNCAFSHARSQKPIAAFITEPPERYAHLTSSQGITAKPTEPAPYSR